VTPTSTPLYRVAGRLLVELRADDLTADATGAPVWPNRAAAPGSAYTAANGHFVATGTAASWPAYTYAGATAVGAVTFAGTSDGSAPDFMEAAWQAFPATSVYGQSDWSVEMWVAPSEWQVNQESPVFQWGGRPGTSCNSAYIGVGSHPSWGAGGHWGGGCDIAFTGPGQFVTQPAGATGFRPLPGQFHHLVLTYSGSPALSDTPFVETLYLNGQVNRVYTNRQLAIPRTVNMRLGTWAGNDIVGQFSLASLRVHDGCLTAGDVIANYNTDALLYMPTPTPTATVTSSASTTASITASASATQIATPSETASASGSRTASATMTPTTLYAAATRVLIDLHAVDYDDATGAWDNRATAGAVSAANGDFLPAAGSTNASWPSKELKGGLTAVVFNTSRTGTAQRLQSANAAFAATSFFGSTDWSFEAWVWTDAIYAENAIFQWGPRSGQACYGGNVGAGSNAAYGAAAFWNCDSGWGNATSGDLTAVAGSGRAPTPGRWHHIAVTYTGATGSPAYLNRIYLNGVLSTEAAGRALFIQRTVPVAVGSWTPANVAANLAVLRLRMHDGCLTPAQVLYNYLQEGEFGAILPTPASTPSSSLTGSASPSASVTPSPTSSPSSTASNTPSASLTGTSSKTSSLTRTPTGSQTGSRSVAPSASSSLTGTASSSGSRTGTASPSATRSSTGTPSASETASVSATSSETASVSASATGTPSASATETGTGSSSASQTGTPSASATETGTPSGSASVTGTPSSSATGSRTGSPPASQTASGTAAATSSVTPAASASGTKTRVALPSGSATRTKTRTRTATRTKTPSKTKTKTKTPSKRKKMMA